MAFTVKKLPVSIKHSLWSVLDAALYPAVYLATVPLMLHSLGYVMFGLWILLNSLITILQLFNFNSGIANLGIATIRNISTAKANNDIALAKDTINTILYITTALLLFVVGIGVVLSYTTVKYGWWGLGDVQGINVSLCVLLTAIFAGLKYFDQVFQSIIKAYERFKMSSVLNMINRFGLLIINLTLALCGYSLVQMLFTNIIFICCYLIVQYICIKRIEPAYNIGRITDKTLYKQLVGISMLPWVQSIIIVCTFQTDRFWVSSYSGLKEVSGYGLASTMFNHVHMIFTAIAVWMLPRIAGMTSRGESPARLYDTVRNFLLGFIVISLLFFYFIAPPLIRFWIGADAFEQMYGYVKSFVAFEIVFAHTILPFFYLNAAGKERLATKLTLMYCSLCYLFMLGALWLFHSPMAMIAGMTLSLCITMPIVNMITHHAMHKQYSIIHAFLEMLPMYAAILLIYWGNSTWLYVGLVIVVLALLWKFYLSDLYNKRSWQRLPNT